MTYTLFATHLPTGHCKECDTINPDIRAEFNVENLYQEFDMVYEKSVLLVIQMFPELFLDKNRRIFFGLHYEQPMTASILKLRFMVVMWMRDNNDVEYYIDKITKNTILDYDQRVDIQKRYGIPSDIAEEVELMKRSTRTIIYPSEPKPDGLKSNAP